jgi:AcrR family transcriptional regulator
MNIKDDIPVKKSGIEETCRRPYTLGKRQIGADTRKRQILAAARQILTSEGITAFTVDAIAQQARVTRQTIHNVFGTRAGILEALFNDLASQGGMGELAGAFQNRDPQNALSAYITTFAKFWSSNRALTRRIHGLAAVDPDLEKVLRQRSEWRIHGLRVLLGRIRHQEGFCCTWDVDIAVRVLYSLTSFEFFDALAGPEQSPEQVSPLVIRLAAAWINSSW